MSSRLMMTLIDGASCWQWRKEKCQHEQCVDADRHSRRRILRLRLTFLLDNLKLFSVFETFHMLLGSELNLDPFIEAG
jgi:hypothetical protein